MSNLDFEDKEEGGGSGGDVTSGELAAVEAKADAAQATADGKVAKAGGTMTGELTVPKAIGRFETSAIEGNDIAVMSRSVYLRGVEASTVTGVMAIKLPVININLRATFNMLLFDTAVAPGGVARAQGLLVLGGTFMANGEATRISAFSSNAHMVKAVRTAWDGTNHYILLEDVSRVWGLPAVNIDILESRHAVELPVAEWSLTFMDAGAEAALDITSTVTMNSGLVPDRIRGPVAKGYLNGSTGVYTTVFDDLGIAVTKTGTGTYQISHGSTELHQLEYLISQSSSSTKLLVWNQFNSTASPITLKVFDISTSTPVLTDDSWGALILWRRH